MLKAGVEEVIRGPRLHRGVEEAAVVVLAGVVATADQGHLQSGRGVLSVQKEVREAQGDTGGHRPHRQRGGNAARHLMTEAYKARLPRLRHRHCHQGGRWRMMVELRMWKIIMGIVGARALEAMGPRPLLKMMMSSIMVRQMAVNLVKSSHIVSLEMNGMDIRLVIWM